MYIGVLVELSNKNIDKKFIYSVPNDLEKNIKSAAELDNTKASGNNPIHFDHTLEESVVFTPAAAVRGILSAQIFCTAGLKGPSNVNGAPPLFFLPKRKAAGMSPAASE